ncbi:hypothetical protein ACIA8I_30625 [Streptomyces rishiriensis]|nr:hypothetical protein [Streptomyces rishiriensis]
MASMREAEATRPILQLSLRHIADKEQQAGRRHCPGLTSVPGLCRLVWR